MFKQIIFSVFLVVCGALPFDRNIQAQELQLLLEGVNDAHLGDGSGLLQVGASSGINLVLDRNEILARNNGANSSLFLNIEGGPVQTGDETNPSNFWATGFTRLGNDPQVPNIKMKHLTATSSPSEVGIVLIDHGIADPSKILAIQIMMALEGGVFVPPNTWITSTNNTYLYSFIIDDGDLAVINNSSDVVGIPPSESPIQSRPLSILITYRE